MKVTQEDYEKLLKQVSDLQAKQVEMTNMLDYATKEYSIVSPKLEDAKVQLQEIEAKKKEIDLNPKIVEHTVFVDKPIETIVEKVVEVMVKDPTIDARERDLKEKTTQLGMAQEDLRIQKERFDREKAIFVKEKADFETNRVEAEKELENLMKLQEEHNEKWNIKEVTKFVDRIVTETIEVPVKMPDYIEKEKEWLAKEKLLNDKEMNLNAREEDLAIEELRIKKIIKKKQLEELT